MSTFKKIDSTKTYKWRYKNRKKIYPNQRCYNSFGSKDPDRWVTSWVDL